MGKFLLLEIGNTNIKIGLCTKSELLFSYALPTDTGITADLLGLRLMDVLAHAKVAGGEIVACVPHRLCLQLILWPGRLASGF